MEVKQEENMSDKNPMCDGSSCMRKNDPVRLYPLGGGGNLILCEACFAHENLYRQHRAKETAQPWNWPQVDWTKATAYETA